MHLVRNLCGKFVKGQCGYEANNALRDALGDRGKIGLAQRRQIGKPIEAAGKLLQSTGFSHLIKGAWMDAGHERFARPKRTAAIAKNLAGPFNLGGHSRCLLPRRFG